MKMELHWSALMGLKHLVLVIIVFFQLHEGLVLAKQCLKNEVLGEVAGNTYQCDEASKPECCEQDNTFTCCEQATTRNLIEQVQLWGIVSAIAVIIIILLFCLCKDVNYCSSEKTVKEKFKEVLCRRNNKLSDVSTTNNSEVDYDDIQSGPSTSPVTSLSLTEPSTRPTTVEKL